MTQRYDWHPPRRPGFRDLPRISWRGWAVFVLAMAGLIALGFVDKQSHYELLAHAQRALCQLGAGSCILHIPVSAYIQLVVNEPIIIAGTKVFVARRKQDDEPIDSHYQALIERKVFNAGGAVAEHRRDADLEISLTVSSFLPASFRPNSQWRQQVWPRSEQTTRTAKISVFRIASAGQPVRSAALRHGDFTSLGDIASMNDVVAFALDTMFERFAIVPVTGTEHLSMSIDYTRRQ